MICTSTCRWSLMCRWTLQMFRMWSVMCRWTLQMFCMKRIEHFARSVQTLSQNPSRYLCHSFWIKWMKKEHNNLQTKTHWQARWKWDSNLNLGVLGRRRQNLDSLLGLGVLTVEMRSEEREAQPWIFYYVVGDEDSAWFLFSALRQEKGKIRNKHREEGQREYGFILFPQIKNFILYKVSAFFLIKHSHSKHIYIFLTLEHII